MTKTTASATTQITVEGFVAFDNSRVKDKFGQYSVYLDLTAESLAALVAIVPPNTKLGRLIKNEYEGVVSYAISLSSFKPFTITRNKKWGSVDCNASIDGDDPAILYLNPVPTAQDTSVAEAAVDKLLV